MKTIYPSILQGKHLSLFHVLKAGSGYFQLPGKLASYYTLYYSLAKQLASHINSNLGQMGQIYANFALQTQSNMPFVKSFVICQTDLIFDSIIILNNPCQKFENKTNYWTLSNLTSMSIKPKCCIPKCRLKTCFTKTC